MSKLIYIFLFLSCFDLPAQTANDRRLSSKDAKRDTGFFVPSSFLPDQAVIKNEVYASGYEGDDIFHPVMPLPREYSLTIFNRWGQAVFSSKELYKGWNGYYKDKISPEGVYFWTITAITADGKKTDRQGSFHLLTRR